jgi:epoxyqueuosine reductase
VKISSPFHASVVRFFVRVKDTRAGDMFHIEFHPSVPYTSGIMTHDDAHRECPRLLLHICCGPCATVAIETLSKVSVITGYYYNPNIYPEAEYFLRRDAAEDVSRQMGIPFVAGLYDQELFSDAVRGFEQEPENGARCTLCYRLRLTATALYARENGFDCFASTLTTGPQKKAAVINPLGTGIGGQYGVTFLEKDWKKQDGFRRSCELARSLGVFRQHYCGCRFSIREGEL